MNSLYVSSNTGHMFGEMLLVLNVSASTRSYMLSNRSSSFASSVSTTIGIIISCTWARISGFESTAFTTVAIVFATPIAANVLSSFASFSMTESRSMARLSVSSALWLSRARRAYVSH